jgi:hypothetical protein
VGDSLLFDPQGVSIQETNKSHILIFFFRSYPRFSVAVARHATCRRGPSHAASPSNGIHGSSYIKALNALVRAAGRVQNIRLLRGRTHTLSPKCQHALGKLSAASVRFVALQVCAFRLPRTSFRLAAGVSALNSNMTMCVTGAIVSTVEYLLPS